MKLKINIYNVIIFLFAIFSLTTLTYRLWPSFIPINRVLGFFIIILFAYVFIKNITTKDALILFIILVLDVFSIIFANDIWQNIEDALYWTITLVILWKLLDKKFINGLISALNDQKKFIKFLVIVENIAIFLGLFIDLCYSGSWNGHYYRFFAYSSHSFSCAACICLALSFVFLKDYKSVWIRFLFLIPCSIAILQSGARTYLFSIVVFWILFYLNYIEKKSVKITILPIIMFVGLYIVFNSSLIVKMTYTANNIYTSEDQLASFTSGRTEFWLIDLKAFGEFNFIHKIFGNGFDYVYYINSTRYDLNIWAHNDIINLLLSVGIVGTLIYLIAYFQLFKFMNRIMKHLNAFLIMVYLFAIMFLNGLFVYQHYLYSFVVLFLVFYQNDCKLRSNPVNTQYVKKTLSLY